MISLAENGETILQQTRSFDADKGTTFALRSKEEADDYRYFPEPDLPPFYISSEHIDAVKAAMPLLPAAMELRFKNEYGLNDYDISVICADREDALFYETLVADNTNYKAAANWMLGPLKAYCNDNNIGLTEFPLTAAGVSSLITFTETGKVSFNVATSRILPAMISNGYEDPALLAEKMNLLQESDEDALEKWVAETIASMPDKVKEYQSGKKGLIGLFAGQVKKLSKGKADMQLVNKILEQQLNKT